MTKKNCEHEYTANAIHNIDYDAEGFERHEECKICLVCGLDLTQGYGGIKQ